MKKPLSFLILNVILFSIVCFSVVPLQAQTPPPPTTDTTHKGIVLFAAQADPSGAIRLEWFSMLNRSVENYLIYRTALPFTDSSDFILIDSTKGNEYEDHIQNSNIGTSVKYAYYINGVTLNGDVVKSNTVTVEIPGIQPKNAFRLKAEPKDGKVNLVWEKPPVAVTSQFSVYRLTPQAGVMMSAIARYDTLLIATTADTSCVDTPTVASSGMNYFAYFVSVNIVDSLTIHSSLAFVFMEKNIITDKVTIVSKPGLTAQIGVPYTYIVKAISTDSTAVIHYFVKSPVRSDSLQCDSISGVITLTPTERQIIPINVTAKSNKGGRAEQEFEIRVAKTNGIISGTVTDTLGNPIKGVFINVLKRDRGEAFLYNAITDSLGKYRISKVDQGSYLVHAIPSRGTYLDQWYNGASSPMDATPVIIADSPSVATVDFVLRNKITPTIQKFTVQGQITDTVGLPISTRGTEVCFVVTAFAQNQNSVHPFIECNSDSDFRLDGKSEFVFKAEVDSTGAYSIKLPAASYIIFAEAPGYMRSFYKNESNFLQADVIILASDTSGISFTLTPIPPIVLGSISGQVLDTTNNVGVPARLIAFRKNLVTERGFRPFKFSFTTETDSTGSYTFNNLPQGNYIVLAIPLGNYAPAFYNDGTSDLKWDKATSIAINGNSVSGINIDVHAIADSSNGYTSIGGTVVESDSGNIPFKGTMVFATNSNGDVVGYAVTDSHGRFTISDLAPGSYNVSVNSPGYQSNDASASPSYDASGSPLNTSVSLSVQTITAVTTTTTVPVKYALNQNYPNPFNPTTRISFSVPNRVKVTLIIYNVLGQEIATLVNSIYNAGTYSIDFNASRLSSGLYFYRIQAGEFSSTKKMILMK